MIYNKKWLIITAHPDDLEAGCGGLVSKVIANGGSVKNLILVKPSVEENKRRNKQIVESELQQSISVLKHQTVMYDTPLHDNGRPNLELTNNLVSWAESQTEDSEILVSHWREDYHQDHRVCYNVAQSISRKNFLQFWCMDYYPYNLHYSNFNCNLYVDITEHIQNKHKALASYKSYHNDDSIHAILDYNKHRGNFIGKEKFAETFNLVYNKTL